MRKTTSAHRKDRQKRSKASTVVPYGHRCFMPGCSAWASFGFRAPGWENLGKESVWACGAHEGCLTMPQTQEGPATV